MNFRISELQYKEIVNITDGSRYGFISDLELDASTGKVLNIIIAGRSRFGGLLGREADVIFPWTAIRRIGSDIILVDVGTDYRENRLATL